MEISVTFDTKILGEALATIIEGEKMKPCDLNDRIREYIRNGTRDSDAIWAIDTLSYAVKQAIEFS
jgi:hypothetical protein